MQFGAIRSRLATLKNRELTENNGHKVTPERKKTILECVLAKDAGGRSQTSQASIRPRSTPVSRVGSRPRAAYIVNFIKNETYGKIPPSMAGRKTKLTPERQEKILKCVRAGMTYKAAAESAGIALETLCRWIARGEKAESGLFHEFYESVQEALADFEWVHLENIERSALKESKITRQTVRYEVGEILNGQLKDGKVKYATTATKSRPRNWKRSAWLLARRFPDRWGPRARGEAHEGEARDRQPTLIYLIPDNGRMRRMEGDKTVQLPGKRPRADNSVNFKIPPNMAGRKTKLTPERQEKILRCVRAGMSYKDAAQSAGITPETLCRWLARGKVESGLFHEFYESVRKALVHFELVHLDNIERSALGETKIIQQTVKYKGGEILNGQLKDGKVKSAEIVSKFRPPKAEASMWLLARRFPERWGPQAKGAAHEGKAPDRRATVIFYKLDKNGRVCDLVLPSDPHFSSEMLKAPDVLQRVQKALLAAGHPHPTA